MTPEHIEYNDKEQEKIVPREGYRIIKSELHGVPDEERKIIYEDDGFTRND